MNKSSNPEARTESSVPPADTPAECIPAALRCHYCGRSFEGSKMASCRSPLCHEFYCRKCLTGQYKYSKKAARMLPTPTWKCPRCTNKCMCSK